MNSNRRRILAIEDDPDDLNQVTGELVRRELAIDVITIGSVIKAMEFLSNNKVDVILLDLGLTIAPEEWKKLKIKSNKYHWEGFYVLEKIRRRNKIIPIIIVTSEFYIEIAPEMRTYENDHLDYVQKGTFQWWIKTVNLIVKFINHSSHGDLSD